MKKIMFNDTYCLTDAVLQKTKTSTRRSNQKLQCLSDLSDSGHTPQIRGNKVVAVKGNEHVVVCNLPFRIGKVVAIAQRYKDVLSYDCADSTSIRIDGIWYEQEGFKPGWNNKMFVKADLMPHQIKITSIKIERLQDISDENCLREGVIKSFVSHPSGSNKMDVYRINEHDLDSYMTPREAFASLINAVSGKGTWEHNPYVLAYEFELVK